MKPGEYNESNGAQCTKPSGSAIPVAAAIYGAKAIGLPAPFAIRWPTTAATQAIASVKTASGAPRAAPASATSFTSPQPIPYPREKIAAAANGTKTTAAETKIPQSCWARAKSTSADNGTSVKTSGTMPQIVSLHQQATSAKTTIAAMPICTGVVPSATNDPPRSAAATMSTAEGGVPGAGPSDSGVTPAQTVRLRCVLRKAMQPKKRAASATAIMACRRNSWRQRLQR